MTRLLPMTRVCFCLLGAAVVYVYWAMALTAGGHQELEAPGRSSDRSCERSLSGQSGGACIAEDELWPKLCTGMEASSQPARDGGQENAAAAGGTEVGAEEAAERAMVVPRRALGKTGMEVSILGYGASPLGGVYGDVNEKDVIQSVRDAIEAGINFFDVSPYYGLGSAEKLLGKALQGIPREKFILSTKVGRYGLDEFDFSAERVTRSVDESLQRLGLDYLDIVLCHDIEFGSIHQVVSETIPALQRLKTAGKLRFIGVSGFPLKIFKLVLDELEPGTLDVVLSYCRCGLNDESLADMLPYLEEKGVGVISASPLSMGLLTDVGPPAWHPAPQALKDACAAAAKHCKEKGGNISTLGLQFATRAPRVAVTLVGMSGVATLRANLAALEAAEKGQIDVELMEEVQKILQPVKNMTWPSGRPENN